VSHLERKIFFLHVPKCGGTSIDAAIGAFYPAEARARMSSKAALAAARLDGVSEGRFTQRLLPYFLAQRRLRYVSGHFRYCEAVHGRFGEEWDFVTVLRHPVSRWLSHYFFNRYKASDHYKIFEELAQFVDSPRGLHIAHTLVTQLSGWEIEDVLARPDDAVRAAIATLDRFTLVGCLERLDDFVSRFATRYDRALHVPELRKSPAPSSLRAEQTTDAIRRRLEEMCRVDLEVYRYALSRGG
jgi:hypothetical protein